MSYVGEFWCLCTVTFEFTNSKKNSFRGNYSRKYGMLICTLYYVPCNGILNLRSFMVYQILVLPKTPLSAQKHLNCLEHSICISLYYNQSHYREVPRRAISLEKNLDSGRVHRPFWAARRAPVLYYQMTASSVLIVKSWFFNIQFSAISKWKIYALCQLC